MSPVAKRRGVMGLVLCGLALAMWLTYTHGHILPAFASTSHDTNATNEIYVGSDQEQVATLRLAKIMNSTHSLEQAKLGAADAVNERLQELDSLHGNVVSNSSLSSTTKDKLLSEITQMKSGLTELAKSIMGTTEETAAFKQNIADITGKYPVYSVLLPQVQGLEVIATDDKVVNAGAQTAAELQLIVNKAKSNNVNASELEKGISTYKSKLVDIATLLTQANSSFIKIDPSNANEAKVERDTGINLLRQVSNQINETSAFLSQSIYPIAKQLNK